MLHFHNIEIVLQEVPNQLSLCFTITGCPLRCKGCHSPYLWKKENGKPLTDELFLDKIEQYDEMVSCILFMGGEWEEKDLIRKLQMAQKRNLYTCLYTGKEDISPIIKKHLTWLKTGAWIAHLGGLESNTTNQKFIELSTGKVLNHLFRKN